MLVWVCVSSKCLGAAAMCECWGYEMECGLCKSSLQVGEKWGHLVLFSVWSVCVFSALYLNLDSVQWRVRRGLRVKTKVADTHIPHTHSHTVTANVFDLHISEDYQHLKLFVCTAHKWALTFNSWACLLSAACSPSHGNVFCFSVASSSSTLTVSVQWCFLYLIFDTAEKLHI